MIIEGVNQSTPSLPKPIGRISMVLSPSICYHLDYLGTMLRIPQIKSANVQRRITGDRGRPDCDTLERGTLEK